MIKKLDNLKWSTRWTSHLGCIKGCLDYLGLNVSNAWLFGGTGHAFILNISNDMCPSGPTAWCTEMLFKLGKNLGYEIDGIFTFKNEKDFEEKRAKAWEFTKKALDENLPCYGWEFHVPEYYVVFGYDNKGYYYSGPLCDNGAGPKPWQELGATDIGIIEMYSVKKGVEADCLKTVRESFEFILEHSKSPERWIFKNYKAGLDGYDNWIKAIEKKDAHDQKIRSAKIKQTLRYW